MTSENFRASARKLAADCTAERYSAINMLWRRVAFFLEGMSKTTL